MISIILPSRGRPEKLKEVIQAIADTVSNPENIEVIIRVDDDDPDSYLFGLPLFCRVISGPRLESKVAVYNESIGMANGDLLMPMGDDSFLISKGWDEIIEKEFAKYPDKILLLYGKDGIHNQRLATHFIISRKMADALGYFSPTLFKAYFGDNFMTDLAVRIRRIKYNPEIVIEHRAAHVGKAKDDETFNDSIGHFQEDQKRYIASAEDLNRAAAILSNLKAEDNGEIKLAIGIPCNFQMVPLAFFESMMLLERPDFELIMKDAGHIDDMRNDVVLTAQRAGCTHLIMMDTDMIYHPQTITKLLAHNLPIVGALTFRRYPPFDPLMLKQAENYKYKTIAEWNEGELIEVDATGTGCIMFNMGIFDKMPFPWFRVRKNPDGSVIGEDIGFCKDLKEAGYKIFVDTAIPSSHLTTLAVNMNTHLLFKARTKARLRQLQKEEVILCPLKQVN